MNIKPYFTYVRTGAFAFATFAAVLLVSWIAGQCRQWRKPKVTPAVVDVGTPVAGPSSSAPTVTEPLPIARPDLTRAELEVYAKKYGLRLTTLAPAASKPSAPPSGLTTVLPQVQTESVANTFPMLLAEESFKHALSGINLDVSAWLPGYGERVDLRAKFLDWSPPPVAAPKGGPSYCMTPERFFANEARFEGGLGAGVVASSKGVGLGPTVDIGYKGPRTGRVTWGAGAHGAYSQQSGFIGDAAFRLTF